MHLRDFFLAKTELERVVLKVNGGENQERTLPHSESSNRAIGALVLLLAFGIYQTKPVTTILK